VIFGCANFQFDKTLDKTITYKMVQPIFLHGSK
jgi:hypothetical protein